jgi:hypothetical protein
VCKRVIRPWSYIPDNTVSGECAEFRHERSGEDGIARQKKGKIFGSFFLIDHRIDPFYFSTAIGNGHPE